MTNALASTTSSSSSSSSSSTASSNVLRITGMASGIDTDTVVKSMVSGYQTKIDKANQAQQTLQWKQDTYRTIITGIKGLQEYFDPLSSKYILSGNTMNINSTANSDSSKFSATAGSSAKTGTYSVTTTQLATQAKVPPGTSLSSMVNIPSGSDGSGWSGATLKLDTNLTLGSSTSLDQTVANINSAISANSTLNGKVIAVKNTDGTHIDFKNTSNDSISLTLGGAPAVNIPKSSTYTDTSGSLLSNANLTVSNTISLDTISSDANNSGNMIDEVVANINSKISANSLLNGKVSASYVTDSSGNHIKFTSASSMSLTATSASGTSGDITSGLSLNSGISSSTKLSDLKITDTATNSFDLSYGASSPVTITAKSTDTLQTIMDQVNSKTNGAVTMSIDDTTGKISFQTKSYGSAAQISISNLKGDASKLGISATTTPVTGTDAIVSITAPGQSAVTTTQSSNRFTSNGVTYSLVNTGTASTTVTSNADTVVSNIKSFINDYNTIISTINTKLTEKKDSAYPPLTDAQKASMSDTQISAWEAKAKVGILRNDDNLSNMMTQLRGIFSSSVYSGYDTSSSTTNTKISLSFGQYGTGAIGIDTSSDYTDGGKLVLQDESKLTDAIENNFDDFKKLFIGTSDKTLSTNQSYVGSSKYMEDGLFTRMSNILNDYVATPGLGTDGTYTLAGSMNQFVNKQYDYSSTGYSGKNTLPDQIYKQTVSIANLKTQMSDAETRYYNKFSALESLMTTLSSQQSTLTSMLG
jgi:flagellar hook-associated protein 2